MEGATHFIEQYRGVNDSPKQFNYCIGAIDRLKYYMDDSKAIGLITIAVWQIKSKPSILITGEEINGTQVLITEKI